MIEIPVPHSVWLDLVTSRKLVSLQAWRSSWIESLEWHPARLDTGIAHHNRALLQGLVGEWALNFWWFDGDERPFWERSVPAQGDGGSDLASGELVNVKTMHQRVVDANPLEFHLLIPQREIRRGTFHVFCILSTDRSMARLMGWTRAWDWAGECFHLGKRGEINAHVSAWKLHPMDTLRACL